MNTTSQTPATIVPTPRPDALGRYGPFGGRYVAETLMPALQALTEGYEEARRDPVFQAELRTLLTRYAGRPTQLWEARRLAEAMGAPHARVLLKREDLLHTGAHKINNTLGQALLARRMGKKRLIAETGAGQHGVATATVAALMGLPCEVFMGAEDVERQKLNVFRMRLLGAQVHAVTSGTATLKDAMNEAMRDWVTTVRDTYYLIGSVAGPHPYPQIVRDFQAVIGDEARATCLAESGRLPDACVACVGGGSNAMGLFAAFVDDAEVRLFGAEAAGDGVETGRHAATLVAGRVGVLHGSKSYVLMNEDGQISNTHSISAGLDYPGVGPEHAWLRHTGRATYLAVTDAMALDGFATLARTEGILCALETAHAIAALRTVLPQLRPDATVVVSLSGRGDKDMLTIAKAMNLDMG